MTFHPLSRPPLGPPGEVKEEVDSHCREILQLKETRLGFSWQHQTWLETGLQHFGGPSRS